MFLDSSKTALILIYADLFLEQKTAKSGAVDRLTDTSKYTGSHKERFDDEGKGKGRAGRKEVVDDSGYVTGYKEKDTFDKKTEDE